MTSWIDGSFIYSTSEAWVNAMRSFTNGTFKSGDSEGMHPRNKDRVPIFTAPVPHIMRMASPEKIAS
jgi:dual oxidase